MPINDGSAAPPLMPAEVAGGSTAPAGQTEAVSGGSVNPPRPHEGAGSGAAAAVAAAATAGRGTLRRKMDNAPFGVVPAYATSWPYPQSIEPADRLTGAASILAGGRMLPVLDAGLDTVYGEPQILAGGTLKGVDIPYTAETDGLSGLGVVLPGGQLRSTTVSYDLRTFDTERVTGAPSIMAGGVIKTTAINYDLRTFDAERITGAGEIRTGGSIA